MDLSDLSHFKIKPVDNQRLKRLALRKIGASSDSQNLRDVELLALRIARILDSVNPRLRNPALLIFAGDHGISKSLAGYLSEEAPTEQKLLDFLHGTAPVNVFAKNASMDVKVIDVGVDFSFEGTLTYWLNHGTKFINRKQAFGTRNFSEFPAITSAELSAAMQVGVEVVDRERNTGCNIIGFGALGRGNLLSGLCLAATILDRPVSDFFPDENPEMQLYLDKAIKSHPKTHDIYTLLSLYGSYDMAALVAAMLRAAHHRMLIIVDDLYISIATLAASRLVPEVLDYCIFSHSSENMAHREVLKELRANPVLKTRLPSMGAGAAYCFPLINNAIDLLSISKK